MKRKASCTHVLSSSHIFNVFHFTTLIGLRYASNLRRRVLNYTYNTFWQCKLRMERRIEGLIRPPSRPRVHSSSPHANPARRVPGRVYTSLFRHRTFQFRRRLWKADQHVWMSATAREWSPLVAGATIWKNRPPKRAVTTNPSRCCWRDSFSLTGKSGIEFRAERCTTEN